MKDSYFLSQSRNSPHLWKRNVHNLLHKSPLIVPTQSQIQSTASQPIYLRSILILPSYVRLGVPSSLFPSGSSYKHYYTVQNNIHNIANAYIKNYLLRVYVEFYNEMNGMQYRPLCKRGATIPLYIYIPVLITRVTYKKHQNYCI